MSKQENKRKLGESTISNNFFDEMDKATIRGGNYREEVGKILEGYKGQPYYQAACRISKQMLMLRELSGKHRGGV